MDSMHISYNLQKGLLRSTNSSSTPVNKASISIKSVWAKEAF